MNKLKPKRRVLIVGEGRETEYNYFVGFRNKFQEDLGAAETSVSVARGKGGNARGIVENAINAAKKFRPVRSRGDRVFLLLDTEGPGRAPELSEAEELAKSKDIEVVFSSPPSSTGCFAILKTSLAATSMIVGPLLPHLTRNGTVSAKPNTTRRTETFLIDCRTCWTWLAPKRWRSTFTI